MDQAHDQNSNIIGKFRLIAELGRGGMSEVYLSVVGGLSGFNKLTVVKLIKGELAEDPEFISMFLEEARLSARLNHPNIVQTNEVGQDGSRYFIAMEYLEGQPYSRIVNRLGRDRGLPIGMHMRILSDVLAGLQYAHELRDFDGSALEVVHRDVTPHNVFVTYDGQVKVVDFGIAKAMNSSHETRTGMLKGKVGYMAPEQARGERVDRRADVFSVGVMLWEAAVGRRMWKGLSEVQVLHQLLAGEIPRPRSMRPDISEHLEAIIMKSIALDRNHRYASATDFQAALDDLMDSGSERHTLREVGRRISSAFEDERTKIRGIIEGQLARSQNLPTGAYNQMQLPVFDQQRMTGESQAMRQEDLYRQSYTPGSGQLPVLGPNTASNPSMRSNGSYTPHSYTGPSPQAPQPQHYSHSGAFPAPPPSVPNVNPTQMPSSYSQPSTGSIAHSSVSTQLARPSSGGSSMRLTLVALAVAAAASILVVVLYVSVGRDKGASDKSTASTSTTSTTAAAQAPAPTTPATNANAVSATSTSSTPAPPGKVSIKVVVKPKDADVFLDDKKLTENPTTIAKDGASHKLRVEASGYTARTRDFTASDDLTWDIELGLAPGVRVPPPPHDSTGSGDNGRMVTTPTSRPIDTGYPGG